MQGYGGSESHPYAAVEKTGERDGGYYTPFSHGMAQRPMCDVWRMIDERGYETTASDNDLQGNGAIGLGSMTQFASLPDLTDERLAELVETGKRNREADRLAKEEAAREYAAAVEQMRREYAHLPNKGKHQRVSKVAANLRVELKRTFPGVKFSVRSSEFAGGDDINVCWEDGPTTSEVEEVTGKYESYSTDISGDYRDYTPNAFTETFGGTKYLFCRRNMSGATEAVIRNTIPDEYGVNDADTLLYRIFENTSMPVGAKATGVKGGKVLFDAPAPASAPVKVAAPAPVAGATVTRNEAKNGIEIRFPSRPGDDVLTSLKANGWRWSRFAGCWYNRASEEAQEFADRIAADFAA